MSKPLDEKKLYKALGRRIAAARKRLESSPLSQSQLADLVGLTRGSIANIERGYQHPPIETLFRLAQALGTEPQVLLPGLADVGVDAAEGPVLTKREKADLKKLGIANGPTAQWMRRAVSALSDGESES
jgi:transcriptional regulator with XRE-family HTH domain